MPVEPERWTIVGGDGLIGARLADGLRARGAVVTATTRRPERVVAGVPFLDLAGDVGGFRAEGGVAVLCAAVTSMQRCRDDPALSHRVNVGNTVRLGVALVRAGAFVVFLSTNQVFDGTRPFRRADDMPCPATVYGRHKAEAERHLLALGNVAVVRLTKVVQPDFPLFRQWCRTLAAGDDVRPFSDMVLAPVPLDDAVEAVARIGRLRRPGIHQVSGAGDVSYAEIARRLAARLGVPADRVRPASAAAAGIEAVPAHTTLDMTQTSALTGLAPATLDAVLATLDVRPGP